MTNAPENRKTHVIRIFGTNSDGDILPELWADVERIDEFTIRTQHGIPQFNFENQYQEVTIKLNWDDDNGDPTEDGEDDSDKQYETLKICNPQNTDDFENPDEWIPIKTIRHMTMSQTDIGESQKRFVAKTVDAQRKVNPRRIYHYDTNIDDDAKAAADAGQKVYKVDGKDYQRDDSTKDDSQYVEHEVIENLEKRNDEPLYASGGDNQGVQLILLNQYLIDESVDAQLDKQGPDNRNPPYRLDPFQNIINVNFSQYDNVAVAGDLCCFVAASRGGGSWEKLGSLGFRDLGEIFANDGEDPADPEFPSEWLIKSKMFVLRGLQQEGRDEDDLPWGESSSDGFGWGACGQGFGLGENTAKLKKQHKPAGLVNGVTFDTQTIHGDSNVIMGSTDGGKSYGVVYASGDYLNYTPVRVVKDDSTPGSQPIACVGAQLNESRGGGGGGGGGGDGGGGGGDGGGDGGGGGDFATTRNRATTRDSITLFDDIIRGVVLISRDGYSWQEAAEMPFAVVAMLSGKVENN